MGVQFRLGVEVGKDVAIEELLGEYDAVFLGTGAGLPWFMNLPGENLGGVYSSNEYLTRANLMRAYLFPEYDTPIARGRRVVTIGGGNTAMDAASESARMGAERVTLAYRRSKEDMGAYEFEYDLAKSVGVKAYFNIAPVEILGDDKVTGVKFIKTETKNGKLITIKGTEFTEECDMVIKATGQSRHFDLYQNIDNLEVDDFGKIVVDENFQTTNPKYYAAGDAVNGGKEVVNSIAEGKRAAMSIIKILNIN